MAALPGFSVHPVGLEAAHLLAQLVDLALDIVEAAREVAEARAQAELEGVDGGQSLGELGFSVNELRPQEIEFGLEGTDALSPFGSGLSQVTMHRTVTVGDAVAAYPSS
jgi:hypothetical protein